MLWPKTFAPRQRPRTGANTHIVNSNARRPLVFGVALRHELQLADLTDRDRNVAVLSTAWSAEGDRYTVLLRLGQRLEAMLTPKLAPLPLSAETYLPCALLPRPSHSSG